MSNFFDLLFSTFKTNFPNMSWKLGSLIRTLLVNPMSKVSTAVSDSLMRTDKLADLQAALDRPESHEDTLDYWLDVLGAPTLYPKPATGSVMFVFTDSRGVDIPKNTELTWGDEESVFTTIAVSAGDVQNNTIAKLGSKSFGIVVPVSTADASDVSLASGLKLNWSDAPSTVLDIYVASPVCGGVLDMDVYSKAALVSSKLNELSLVSSQGLTSILVSKYLPTIVSVEVIKTTNSNTPTAAMSVCLKQRRPPTFDIAEYRIECDSLGNPYVLIAKPGLSSVLYVRSSLTGDVLNYTVTDQSDTVNSDSVKISLSDTSTTDSSVIIATSRFADTIDPVNWLNSANSTLPFTVTSKPALAINVTVKLTISSGELSHEAKVAIADYICSTRLNESIDASRIASILAESGVTLARPALLVGRRYDSSGDAEVCSTGGLSSISFTDQQDKQIAFYSSVSDVQVM